MNKADSRFNQQNHFNTFLQKTVYVKIPLKFPFQYKINKLNKAN